jgi:hypothetical protein
MSKAPKVESAQDTVTTFWQAKLAEFLSGTFIGPSQPLEIRAAGPLGPELGLEFRLISRVIRRGPEHYMLGSPESSG